MKNFAERQESALIFIGIDPGYSGAAAIIHNVNVSAIPFKNMTDKDITDAINLARIDRPDDEIFAVLESVHSMPKQGVASSFKFGKNFGLLLGCLYTGGYQFELVSPQKWQKAIGCLSHGDKNITKSAAQRLFPQLKITHAIADALLLAEYARRIWNTRNRPKEVRIEKNPLPDFTLEGGAL